MWLWFNVIKYICAAEERCQITCDYIDYIEFLQEGKITILMNWTLLFNGDNTNTSLTAGGSLVKRRDYGAASAGDWKNHYRVVNLTFL